MNASLKGFLSEHAAAIELMARGFEVYTPLVDIYGYDLLVLKNNRHIKIQVKASYKTDGKYTFNCHYGKYANKPYTADMVDYFLFYIADQNIWYIIPCDEIISGSGHITLTVTESNKYYTFKENWELLEE